MKHNLIRFWPFLVFLACFIFIFSKVFLNHLVPVPTDLLVSFFYPYNSGGWQGFSPWTTHKEFIAADVVRQVFPWRSIGIQMIKEGIVPLWNPYAFAGYPLLANLQSALVYPLNIIFFVVNDKLAWVIYVLLFPIIGFIGMYLFLRSLRISQYGSLFGGLVFPFIGYFNNWFELGVVTHTGVWLPYILFAINQFISTKNKNWLLVGSISIFLTLVAGHAQTAAYVILFSIAYYCFYTRKLSLKKQLKHCWFFILGIALAAIQLVPTLELLQLSARNTSQSTEIFYRFQFAWQHLVTILSPDFFGNPVTNNFWGVSYGEFQLYFGAIAFFYFIIGMTKIRKEKLIMFLFFFGFVSFLFALPTPLSSLLQILNIPILGTSIPSRILFITQVCFVIIASFGIDELFVKSAISKKAIIVTFALYFFLWVFVFVGGKFLSSPVSNLAIAKRNLALPTGLILVGIIGYIVSKRIPRFAVAIFFLLLIFSTVDIWYITSKNFPYAPFTFFFPNHPLITYLSDTVGNDRVFGYDTARLETNLQTQWRLQSPEGYDPLAIKRYSELLASTKDDTLPTLIPRSDAVFQNTLPQEDSYGKHVVLNILGTKYVLDKQDNPPSKFSPDTNRYPEDLYKLSWQEGKWQVYENKNALSRAMVYYNSKPVQSDKNTIATLFSKEFPYKNTLLVNSTSITNENLSATSAAITHYSPTNISISVNASENGYLFLADNNYPGWKAYINSEEVPIHQADYTFRAVQVPKGQSNVTFTYDPMSFKVGWIISLVSIVIGLAVFFIPKKKYES